MADDTAMMGAGSRPVRPIVRPIRIADLSDALARGFEDFRANPAQAMGLCLIFPVVGLVIGSLAYGYGMLARLFPLAAGFALIGPFAVIGLYELSRRREQGLGFTWRNAFDVRRSNSVGAIVLLGLILAAIFLIWIKLAQALYDWMLGDIPPSLGDLIREVFTTSGGFALLFVGNFIGFLFAIVVLTLSVVSFPLLVDRNVGATTSERLSVAVGTSARAVLMNPSPMAVWGLIIAVSLAIGTVPFFLGLIVVVPWLGYATWHLYRKVVATGD